jgi:peroxin-19
MMGQLVGKDVLYEPSKEFSDKVGPFLDITEPLIFPSSYLQFPDYLKANANTLTSNDKSRYDAQIICMKQLLEIFES